MTVTPARRRRSAMVSMLGFASFAPLLKWRLPLISAPRKSPSTPTTTGPFCQLQPPTTPPRIPFESICPLAGAKS